MAGKLHLRPASRARDESYLRNHVLPAFGPAPLSRIHKSEVKAWVAMLSVEKGLAPKTVKECHRLLSMMMAEAVDSKLIAESPCRGISLPRAERREKRFLTPEEVEHLAQAFDLRYSAYAYSGAYLGCRWGELAGLMRKHLNLLKLEAKIVGSLERVRGSFRYVEETKTISSRRTLPIPPMLGEILADHLARVPDSEYVFPAPDGGLLYYSGFRQRFWNPAVEKAGLAPLTPHELRHTFVALLIAEGADPLTIQRRLGHKDIRTTLNEYGHLFPDKDLALTQRMDGVLRGAKHGSSVGFSWDSQPSKVVPLPLREAE
jgi:integrase